MKYKLLRNESSEEIDLIMSDSEKIPLVVNRQVYMQKDLYKLTGYQKQAFSMKNYLRKHCRCPGLKVLHNMMPIVRWIPTYPWRTDLLADLIAGITIGSITLPQAMAYAMLANTPPVVGLYMAIFPVIMYFLFSTSRHNSIGTFAIVCLMSGKIVDKHSIRETTPQDFARNKTLAESGTYPSTDVAATVAFTVAIFQVAMYLLRVGILANILSDVLVNGFTAGAACHVLCSQLPLLLGVKTKRERGFFSIPKTVKAVLGALPGTNRVTVSMAFVAILLMVINNEIVKPWLQRYTQIPIPIELLVVIIGSAVSYVGDLAKTQNVFIVDYIPTGLPYPRLPIFTLIPEIFIDCFLITVVSYSITISMATLFAQKSQYNVKPNQELFAMSMANLCGAFFSCLPICASLARTFVQWKSGGKTQFASIIASFFILIILLFIAPLFEPLPRCILASIIVLALKGLLQQIREVPDLIKVNYWDTIIWISTFFPTVFISIDIGLLLGVLVSVTILFIRGHRPQTCVLAHMPNTDIYLDIEKHGGLEEIDGIKIFRYCGSLNFALKAHFKRIVYEVAMLKPSKIVRHLINPFTEDDHDHIIRSMVTLRCLIIDFSGLTYIDPACIALLKTLILEYSDCSVSTYLAGCSTFILETFTRYERHKKTVLPLVTFVSIHDAVLYAQRHALEEKPSKIITKELYIHK